MSLWSEIKETPSQQKASIVFTAGGTTTINVSASKVFDIITCFQEYEKWNTWSPIFSFPESEQVKVGSRGTLLAKMEAQNRDYEIPVEVLNIILRLSSTTEHHELAWRGLLMPSWFAVSERVQTVVPLEDKNMCEVKNWESMSGWGTYVLKYGMGVEKQLQDANLKYLTDLKVYAEQN